MKAAAQVDQGQAGAYRLAAFVAFIDARPSQGLILVLDREDAEADGKIVLQRELLQAELDRRLNELRATNPATAERARIERDHTRTTKAINRLVQAYQEDLLTLGELRARMPDLRAKQAGLQTALDGLLPLPVLDR